MTQQQWDHQVQTHIARTVEHYRQEYLRKEALAKAARLARAGRRLRLRITYR